MKESMYELLERASKPKKKEERIKILHTPTTHDIFVCLSDMIAYCRILLEQGQQKPYRDFLNRIIEMNFCKNEERINIKKIAAELKIEAGKITKWIAHDIQSFNIIN